MTSGHLTRLFSNVRTDMQFLGVPAFSHSFYAQPSASRLHYDGIILKIEMPAGQYVGFAPAARFCKQSVQHARRARRASFLVREWLLPQQLTLTEHRTRYRPPIKNGQTAKLKIPTSRPPIARSCPWQLRHLQELAATKAVEARATPPLFSIASTRPALFVASMVDERGNIIIHAFAASVAACVHDFRERLAVRVGIRTASTATIIEGFDPSEPIAASLLPDSIAEILLDVRDNPGSMLAAGLDVLVEHRFALDLDRAAPLCRYD